ncbi:MAG TPA: GNAT family N-acetyltransferase [Solirubrobacterales bacterium]|nr:GNAT family N-acetyltransferase [Solirubrobacterales bacterium]
MAGLLQDAEPEGSPELLIRAARADERLDIARVHVRSWQVAYRGLIAGEFLDSLRPEQRVDWYHFDPPNPADPQTTVALAGDRLVGFSSFGPTRDDDARGAGEIYALYVDPDHWSGGVGRRLLADSRRRLADAGYADAVLWVLRGNEAAERFYLADGWRRDGVTRMEDPYGPRVEVRRFRRRLDD